MQYFDTHVIDQIRHGFYSAIYFDRTQQILLQEKNYQSVTMQIFQKQNQTVIAGIPQVHELLQEATGYFDHTTWKSTYDQLRIEAVNEGETVQGWEPIIHITGPYAYFAHLESVYLGILARASNIATNTKRVVQAAEKKPIIFFADRFDYFLTQELDGYAAKLAGVSGVATPAHSHWWNGSPMGTIPHALIAAYEGNTIKAAEVFAHQFPDIPLIVLVDFANDCVKTALEVAHHFGTRLFGVRIDTSEKMIDMSVKKQQLRGVNPQLVKNVRQALDTEGFSHVKIIVSGGFTAEKIALFEKEQVPVDMYGVGSSLLTGNIDFTADIVKVGEKHIAKEGRSFQQSKKLQVIA